MSLHSLITMFVFGLLSLGQTSFSQTIQTGFFTGAEGHQIFFRSVGDNAADTLVYLHGGPGFDMQDGGLEFDGLGSDYRFIAYDQRGGGYSDITTNPADLTWQDHVADLEALRLHFGIDKLTLVGNSWGAGLAVLYHSVYPQNVKRMVLGNPMTIRELMWGYRAQNVNSLIPLPELQRFIEILGIDQNTLTDQEVIDLCYEYIEIALGPYLTGTPLSAMNGDYCDSDPEGMRVRWINNGATWSSILGWDWRGIAGDIQVPVLIFDGDITTVPKNTTREWASYIPNSRYIFTANAGHLSWLDNPAQVQADMRSFFSGFWPAGSKAGDDLELDMLARYDLAGETINNSDNYHDGQVSGNVTFSSDRFNTQNSAASFANGAAITVSTPNWYPDTNHWSWSAWVQFKSSNSRTILSHDDLVLSVAQGSAQFQFSNVNLNAATSMAKDEWHHLAVVRDGDTVHLYQNGQLAASASALNLVTPAGDFQMGNDQGDLDDVRIYARSLSADDINRLRYSLNN